MSRTAATRAASLSSFPAPLRLATYFRRAWALVVVVLNLSRAVTADSERRRARSRVMSKASRRRAPALGVPSSHSEGTSLACPLRLDRLLTQQPLDIRRSHEP